MRRDVGRHARRRSGGPVDRHSWDDGRQQRRVLSGAVVVRFERDGSGRRDPPSTSEAIGNHPALGVTHRPRRCRPSIAAEVATASIIGHPATRTTGSSDEGLVDRAVAVRV